MFHEEPCAHAAHGCNERECVSYILCATMACPAQEQRQPTQYRGWHIAGVPRTYGSLLHCCHGTVPRILMPQVLDKDIERLGPQLLSALQIHTSRAEGTPTGRTLATVLLTTVLPSTVASLMNSGLRVLEQHPEREGTESCGLMVCHSRESAAYSAFKSGSSMT